MTRSDLAQLAYPQIAMTHTRAVLQRYAPGVLLSGVLASVAMALGQLDWLRKHGLSALSLAILLGILLGNTVYGRLAAPCAPGVTLAKQRLLRLGIVLYGLRLTLHDIGQVGLAGVLIDALVLGSTFTLAYLLGTRWLKLEPKAAILIGAGSSICGAAAVMATEPVLRARAEHVTVAVATVVVFGTLAMWLYPWLFVLNQHWPVVGGGVHGFGMYVGSTIHEVAQVVAAAHSVDSAAADTAVITKMVRVMMLAPFLMGLSAWLACHQRPAQWPVPHRGARSRWSNIRMPWFAFAFIAMVAFNSLQWLPHPVVVWVIDVDTVLLAMAMAALGLTTHLSAVRHAGVKPLLLAGVLFVWLVVGGALIHRAVLSLL